MLHFISYSFVVLHYNSQVFIYIYQSEDVLDTEPICVPWYSRENGYHVTTIAIYCVGVVLRVDCFMLLFCFVFFLKKKSKCFKLKQRIIFRLKKDNSYARVCYQLLPDSFYYKSIVFLSTVY